MKVYDLSFIPKDIYHAIICDHPRLLTTAVNHLMGIKYYSTEYSKLDPIYVEAYVFEVLDPKKLILYKFKYDF